MFGTLFFFLWSNARRVLSSSEKAKQAPTSATLSLSGSFRLDPLDEKLPALEVSQSADLGLNLRLLAIEGQQCRDAVDHISHSNASQASQIRTVHLDLSKGDASLCLADAFSLE